MKPFAVESPCSESWDAMRKLSGPARHCASCDKAVFDFARMTPSEIRGVTELSGGKLCARQTIVGGELNVRPEPGTARSPWRIVTRGAVLASALAAAACEGAASAAPTGDPIIVIAGDPRPGDPAPTPPPTPTLPPDPSDEHEVIAGGLKYTPQPTQGAIAFATGKTALPRTSRPQLDAVAAALRANTWIEAIAIYGDAADDEGTPAVRGRLARARAQSIRDYLVKRGVDAARLRLGLADGAPSRVVRFSICEGERCP